MSQNPTSERKFDLSSIPFVQNIPTDGRRVILLTYYDHERGTWHGYILQNGAIQQIGFTSLVTGIYIAQQPASPETDFRFELSELVVQHFCQPTLDDINDRVRADIFNGLASLQKYFVILQHVNESKRRENIRLMTTEVEYAFANYRSFYDLLNRIVQEVFSRATPPPQALPDSFAKVAQVVTADLKKNYRMPDAMAEFYEAKRAVFMQIRKIRDSFVHHGHTPETIFHFDDGFGVALDRNRFSELRQFGLWSEENLKPNNIGSLLELFVFLVQDMWQSAADLAAALRSCFAQLPIPVSPGYNVYFRSELNFHIPQFSKYRTNPWMHPELGLQQ